MEGDVDGVMQKPEGGDKDKISDQEKWYAKAFVANKHLGVGLVDVDIATGKRGILMLAYRGQKQRGNTFQP